ncbi:unnamed protein product [Symbiodinium necroappetens]|uniref:Uncharacterized protein n=1 Tax=Symbiodinium necroappetens TaxID=1628268 RepID=A0A813BZT2_9DINO|nr:unnamed protein product [Symbiodinium necroappetens]
MAELPVPHAPHALAFAILLTLLVLRSKHTLRGLSAQRAWIGDVERSPSSSARLDVLALDPKLPCQELTEKIRSELISNAEEEAAPIVAGHPGVHGLAAWLSVSLPLHEVNLEGVNVEENMFRTSGQLCHGEDPPDPGINTKLGTSKFQKGIAETRVHT